ncbi:MAG: hypothetical protein K6E11_01925 [Bacilli bacterium]|nr:hypothetical protein [Bacilli bacterium]
MVDLSFIRKRKAKKIVALVGGLCGAAVVVVSAVALLGQRAAPLTVKLTNSGASLALFKSEFENDRKSFLLATDSKPYTEISEPALRAYESVLDVDDSKPLLTSDEQSLQFYQYTFYLTNSGASAADYTFSLNISYPHRSSFDLADVLRVRFYENDGNDKLTHNYKTYAKHSDIYNAETGEYEPERISGSQSEFAEKFENANTVLTQNVSAFPAGAVTRYTVVVWIEGEDPQSKGPAPVDSGIALGVNISAHEAEETPLE